MMLLLNPKLKVNNDNLKFNSDFKSHITVERYQDNTKKAPNIFYFFIGLFIIYY
jgi:hypothetical protein